MFQWLINLFSEKSFPLPAAQSSSEEKRQADTREPFFFSEIRHGKEAVVFVHGLGGHFRDTWKRFPELLDSDPDLPRLQILLAGYDASPTPWTHSIKSEGQRFISNLRSLFVRDEELFLVGHSMGGLVILHGLVQELIDSRAQVHPVNGVCHVTLYASPVLGTQVATILAGAAKVPVVGGLVSEQLQALAPGDFVAELISEVANRIYNPTISPGEASSKREIAITACVGLKDQVVPQHSARAIFKTPPPVLLDHGHSAVKEPESRSDFRYLPLKNILEEHFIGWLETWRAKMADPVQVRDARNELMRRLRHGLESRLATHKGIGWAGLDAAQREERVRRYFSVLVDPSCFREDLRLGDMMNLALLELEN